MFNKTKFYKGFRPYYKTLTQKNLTATVVDNVDFLLDSFSADPTWGRIEHVAYAFATITRETGYTYAPITEYGGVKYFTKYDVGKLAKALGNTPEADGDGYKYRGRGYVQITGASNYRKMSKVLGVDLMVSPELTLNRAYAFDIMTYGMFNGTFTAKKITDYISSTQVDYKNARKVINGLDHAQEIANTAKQFEKILRDSFEEVSSLLAIKSITEEEEEEIVIVSDGDAPKDGEPAPDTPAKSYEAIVGGRPEDSPLMISESTVTSPTGWNTWKTTATSVIGALGLSTAGIGTMFSGIVSNPILSAILGWGVVSLLVGALIFGLVYLIIRYKNGKNREDQAFELNKLKLQIFSDPTKYNVDMKSALHVIQSTK